MTAAPCLRLVPDLGQEWSVGRPQLAADAAFDAVFPGPLRAASAHFWTPVAVAQRAAQLFAEQGVRRVLDVGSGAGKFCLVAASACPEIQFTGVEHRPHLVEVATAAAAHLGLGNVSFHAGDATTFGAARFDGLYLFNPFAENTCTEDERLDTTVELSRDRFAADVGRVVATLQAAAVGACMVTYHGFGGPVPTTWTLEHAERAHSAWLRVWKKERPGGELGAFYLEDGDDVLSVDAWAGRPIVARHDGGGPRTP